MKTKKDDLLELQNLFLQSKHARGDRKEKQLKAIEKVKNRLPEHLAQRVEDLLARGIMALVPVFNGTCSGCYLQMPRGIVNSLVYSGGLALCENCGRFVYGEPVEREDSSGIVRITSDRE